LADRDPLPDPLPVSYRVRASAIDPSAIDPSAPIPSLGVYASALRERGDLGRGCDRDLSSAIYALRRRQHPQRINR
jgi:hypothetical protein